MSTVIRPEVSKKSKYWISKHRYYELKHFCMQYNEWTDILRDMNFYPSLGNEFVDSGKVAQPVEQFVEMRSVCRHNILLVEDCCNDADPDLARYLLVGVTQSISYDILYARLEIPCSKDYYYDIYRKFFWLLDRARK